MRCVAKVGYSRATIREIARMANVTSASLYNYFPNKSELIKAAIAARTDVAMPRLRSGRTARRHRRPNRSGARRMGPVDPRVPRPGRFRVGDPGAKSVGRLRRPRSAGSDRGFQTFREIIEGIVDDALPASGDLGDRPGSAGHCRGDLCAHLRPDRAGGHLAAGGLPGGAGLGEVTGQRHAVRPVIGRPPDGSELHIPLI